MRRIVVLAAVFFMLLLTGCTPLKSPIKWQASVVRNPLEDELGKSLRIVFVNKKEPSLKFTVSDPKVVGQIAGIMTKGKTLNNSPGVDADYTIKFYLPSGKQVTYDYWMGAAENSREVNLLDENGTYFMISDSLDVYIINSTRMALRPKQFVNLYTACLSESISLLDKDTDITIGIDMKSDRRMRRYTMSYEEERILQGLSAQGYKVFPFNNDEKYVYTLTFLTNIYNPDKAQISVEVVKSSDKTKQIFKFESVLKDGIWITSRVVDDTKK